MPAAEGRRPTAAPAVALTALLLLAAPAATAVAGALHTRLESSVPADGDTLRAAPAEARLRFTGRIESRVTMTLAGAGGRWRLDATRDSANPQAAFAPLPPLAASGDYALSFRVISADGHAIEEAIRFRLELPAEATAGPEAAPAETAPMEAAAPASPAPAAQTQDPLPLVQSVLRGASAFLLLALAGLLLFLVLPGAETGSTARRWALALALATPILLAGHVVAWAAGAGGGPVTDTGMLVGMLATTPGRIELARLAAALLALLALGLARRPTLALAFATAGVLASGALGHSAAMSPAIAIPAKAIHLAAVAIWLGGLLYLATASREPAVFREAALTVSGLALAAVIAVVLTGLLQSLLFMDAPGDLLTTRYGLLVVAKAAGLGILVAFGARNRYRLIPGLDGTGDTLRRSVGWEMAVMLGVLLVAGLLANVSPVEHEPPATAAVQPAAPGGPIDE